MSEYHPHPRGHPDVAAETSLCKIEWRFRLRIHQSVRKETPKRPQWLLRSLLSLGLAFAMNTALGGGPVRAQSAAPEPLSAFPQDVLAIRTPSGHVLNFLVWIADRPSREEQGLMFVHEMDDHAGMLFLFPGGQRISMWMKNTYISLDMLFINADGRVDYIASHATPLSLDIISAPNPARAVLELKGGISEKLGIRVGDTVLVKELKRSQ